LSAFLTDIIIGVLILVVTVHFGPAQSGAGTGNPALAGTLLWNYTTGGVVESSPAVVDGVVYSANISEGFNGGVKE